MSIILCESCDQPIDSDEDPDCFVEVGNMRRLNETKVWCASCRERKQAEQEAEQDAADAACAEAEAKEEETVSLDQLKKDLSQ